MLLFLGGVRIYHAGDTGLFYDMKLIGKDDLDLAMLPIGDNFTMGPDDALSAVDLLEPKTVVPMHYDTFDAIQQDAVEAKKMAIPPMVGVGVRCHRSVRGNDTQPALKLYFRMSGRLSQHNKREEPKVNQ